MITLYNGNLEIKLPVTDDSYSYNAVMGENSLTLYFSSEKFVEIPIGSYCNFGGEHYSLKKDSNFTKQGTRNYEYTLLLETDQADLKLWKIRNPVDNRIKFSYTATPREHLELFVANANRRSSGWKVGECIEGKEVTFEYNHTYILDGLNDFASQLGTEWQISNKTVHLRKVEYNKNNPLVLSYGKGNGFKTGVGREMGDVPVEILLVQGTDKNIDYSKYGNKELLLPKSKTLVYEGRTYITSADGLSVMNANRPLTTAHEDSLDCSEIYPSREGTVGSVIEADAEKNFYDIIDDSIPDDLNFEDYLIEGENMTIIFQTGMLAGSDKEFEAKYYHKPVTVKGKTKAGKRFEIAPQEIDGITMPDGKIFTPKTGDKYAVFGIQLPDAYICDDETQTGASWDMFREAAKYLYEHEDKKFTFTGILDGIWAKKRWLQIGGKIILGGYVLFSDEQFMPDGSLIRITGVKRYVNKPYKPEIELSNTTVGSSISSDLNKPGQNEVLIEDTNKETIRFAKRRFRDAKETMKLLQDALLNFSDAITPITVQTMQLLVGDESLQFRFVNNTINPVQIPHIVTFNETTQSLHAPAGIIQHMTLGIKDISSSHKIGEYKFWNLSDYNSPTLASDKAYYLYAKVSKSESKGTFLLSEKSIKIEQVTGYYHLLVGILNSEFDGERSFVELHGFTEVLPGRITTDRVVSSDGLNFLDFINNAFRVGNNEQYIDFNSKGDGKLRLKGSLVQSESGDESPIGCFRGTYNSSYTYYTGDEVTYKDSVGLSTYRYKYPTPAKGIPPTNSSYWEIVARCGIGINDTDVLYAISSSNTTAPTSGWKTYAPAWTNGKYIWSKTKVIYSDGTVTYTDAACITGGKGETGNGISRIVEQYYLSSSSTTLSNGTWSTTRPSWRDEWYIWTRSVIYYTDGNSITTDAICVTGGKGETGDDGKNGDYYEYRYAVNGSRTTPPSLVKTDTAPSGWNTSMPSVGSLQYLWMIVSKKSGTTGGLLINWSTPVRQTPYDGIDGNDGNAGPTMVYRGIYSSSKIYYGTSKRVDAVKYNGHYYVSRVDGGNGFHNHVPTDTSYWNDFGAEFESIATNLLLAEGANIGDWFMSGGKIVSTLLDGNKIILDASMSRIIIESSYSGGDYSEATEQGAIIKIDASNGLIEARSKTNSRVAYMSPTGIFCNNAETQTVSAILGVTHKAAVVGLGFGNVNKNQWDNENFIAGVYGTAKNSGNAPAYGGFFQNLMAAGLILHIKAVEESSNSVYLTENDSIAIGYSRNNQNVYLPTDGIIGRVVFVRQWWSGQITLMSRGGQKMYYNSDIVNSFKIVSGETAMCIFCIGYISGIKTEAWIVNSFKTGA